MPGQSEARGRLARLLEDQLFFAGEARHPFDFTTVHKAHNSGQRAANEAMEALRDSVSRGRPVAIATTTRAAK